ncbi:hypothetical protein CPB83DRAFT_861471 [Crepidotus variabilis]|uniref:Uncharacterized protein n=1 Tax=Crepidotus variabilis TaxID=179855 RepID=A0A9P6E898_9AGAR|nr:hypothetical protein CPB83DRAFT_861471 [Crepidotus variabilis]
MKINDVGCRGEIPITVSMFSIYMIASWVNRAEKDRSKMSRTTRMREVLVENDHEDVVAAGYLK